MNTEPITNRCPKCQAPLPANAPRGLCPKCLLAAASSPTEAGQPTEDNPAPPIDAVAAAFPQLEILGIIGQGGMGVVYKARQPHLDRFVALKVLAQSLAADLTFAERFNREARVLARLNHPNIVTVHDYGQSGGFFYLLMEFVDGVNLRQAMQAGRFTTQQAMMLVPKICEALQFAHDEGILHRDIKPANILLDTRGRVKIADFGIAKLVGEAKENLTLTASGMAVGTPHYMAPEQLEHPQDVDQRADIYSLGVVFYEMLTGELPIGRFAPPSQKSAVDARVDDVVFHALEPEREKRFRTASEVKTSVEAITSQIAAQPPRLPSATAPGQPSAAADVPGVRVPCYFNTPSRMRDCFPSTAARIFTCKGELALGVESLTFTSIWRTAMIIPLKDIEDLSVGQFQMWTSPWVMKYARINFLSLSFREGGQLKTVLLTPTEAGATSASQINEGVGRWFERVRQAVRQCTGRVPQASDTASVSISAEPAWNLKALPLIVGCLIVGVATWFFQSPRVAAPIWIAAIVVDIFLLAALLWFSVGFLRANSALWHGSLDIVTSDDPPAPERADTGNALVGVTVSHFKMSYVLVLLAVLMAPLLVLLWGLGNSYFPQMGQRLGNTSPARTDSQFVLYTIPTPVASDPTNQLLWKFKFLVPADHMARILFVRWSNGVPVIENAGSAYYEVGKASMDQDVLVSCTPVPDAPFQGPTNTVPWGVSLFGNRTTLVTVPRQAPYRRLDTPAHLTLGSGHQRILGLVDYTTPAGQPTLGKSGIELRVFLEPMKFAPLRTDPFQVQEQNYVAGIGSGWTTDQALDAIKQWPIEE